MEIVCSPRPDREGCPLARSAKRHKTVVAPALCATYYSVSMSWTKPDSDRGAAQSRTRPTAEQIMARLLSVNVGLPRDIDWKGRTVYTGIWKSPVQGRC